MTLSYYLQIEFASVLWILYSLYEILYLNSPLWHNKTVTLLSKDFEYNLPISKTEITSYSKNSYSPKSLGDFIYVFSLYVLCTERINYFFTPLYDGFRCVTSKDFRESLEPILNTIFIVRGST